MPLILPRAMRGQLVYPRQAHLIVGDSELLSHSPSKYKGKKRSLRPSPLPHVDHSIAQRMSTTPLFANDVGPWGDFPEAYTSIQENWGDRQIMAPYPIDIHILRQGESHQVRTFGLDSGPHPSLTSHLVHPCW